MSFTEAIKTCFRKYANFRGRAGRAEYWWFFLFTAIVAVIPYAGFISLGLLPPYLAATVRRLHDTNRTGRWLWLLAGVVVVVMIPGAYVGAFIARWAGGGLPEMVIGASVIASSAGLWGVIVGFLVLLPFLIKPGDPGPNRYGPNPLQMPPGMPGHDNTNPGQPYAPRPYNAAPPAPTFQPSGRQYCPQCGLERAAAAAQYCTLCGAAF